MEVNQHPSTALPDHTWALRLPLRVPFHQSAPRLGLAHRLRQQLVQLDPIRGQEILDHEVPAEVPPIDRPFGKPPSVVVEHDLDPVPEVVVGVRPGRCEIGRVVRVAFGQPRRQVACSAEPDLGGAPDRAPPRGRSLPPSIPRVSSDADPIRCAGPRLRSSVARERRFRPRKSPGPAPRFSSRPICG